MHEMKTASYSRKSDDRRDRVAAKDFSPFHLMAVPVATGRSFWKARSMAEWRTGAGESISQDIERLV